MISYFRSHRKERNQAEEQVRLAQKIEDYRRDVLSEKDLQALRAGRERLEEALKNNDSGPKEWDAAFNELEPVMKRCGGSFYPRGFWAENIEMILVAAILAIGVRTFFIQPFKIPTNSMYPTYNGMTSHVYEDVSTAPGFIGKVARFVTLGSKNYSLEAPVSGELGFSPEPEIVQGRKYFILPTPKVRYTFYVGDQPLSLDLPLDFDFRQVAESFLGDNVRRSSLAGGKRILRTGRSVEAGEKILSFDLLTGDQLFVDRFSYHFARPEVGQPFVFRTEKIEHIDAENRGKYYIKRIAGGPGDILQIRPPVLYLNGEPADAVEAFGRNARQEGEYPGYVTVGSSMNYPLPRASGREPIEIPKNHYFAMGDNSPNSADSRMWGFVPEREIVGKALFIYYPFSHRWGVAE